MNGANDEEFSEWYLFEREIEKLRTKRKKRDPTRELVAAPRESVDITWDYFSYRSRGLEERVAAARHELYSRLEVRDTGLEQIDYQIRKASLMLESLSNRGLGYNVGVDVARNQLARHLADLRRERRQLELKGWSDVVELKRYLRRAQDELLDAERRRRMAKG